MRPGRQAAPTDEPLVLEGLVFALRRSPRRRTVGITVERDGSLRVAAPARLARRRLEEAVRGKLPWVRKKLAELAAAPPPPEPPHYVEGDLLPYLGRRYPLRLAERGGATPVALRRGAVELERRLGGTPAGRQAVLDWYLSRASAVIGRRVGHFVPLAGARPAELRVRDLGRRWGSCAAAAGRLDFHWQLVLLPQDLIDYVVVHELMHLHRADHSPAFWARVGAVLPDWKRRRTRLRELGRRLVV